MILGFPTLTFYFLLGFPVVAIVLSVLYVFWFFPKYEAEMEELEEGEINKNSG